MDYKKILEGVVNIINTTEKSDIGFANICTYIGENCPELKESEGERVKKDIKRAISVALDYCYFNKETANNCLAWLEKQGEKNEIDYDEEIKKCKANPLYFFDKYVKVKLKKQNSAWSKEDERQWNNIYDVLDGHFELSEEGYKNAANWFKAIKGRVQPQNTWKPSGSDILLLEKIANGKSNPQDFQASLWGLIGQLKKLREE